MPDTVIFHIGTIKTGTTSLQNFCYLNRDALLKEDIDYIQFQPPRLDLPRWANADVLLNPEFDVALVKEQIASSTASRILISEEGLMSRPHIWEHSVFKGLQRVAILYLRNPVELVASWASENSLPYNFAQAEHASGRGVVSVEEGLAIWTAEYASMLREVYRAFESQSDLRVVLRPFPPPEPQAENLIAGFLNILGVSRSAASSLYRKSEALVRNAGHSRRYVDAAYLLSRLVQKFERQTTYDNHFVDHICAQLQSGDDRKVLQTLTDVEVATIDAALEGPTRVLVDAFGLNDSLLALPDECSGTREPWSRVNHDELMALFCNYFK